MNNAIEWFLVILALLLGSTTVWAQPSESWREAGELTLRYIDPAAYKADKENWAVIQDEQGLLYVANSEGLLIYDGQSWELIESPNGIVRSIDIGKDGRPFIGSIGDLGYIAPDSLGELRFVSLKRYIPEKNHDFLDIWQTVATSAGVYFLSENYIFRWSDEAIRVWETDTHFLSLVALNDNIFVLSATDTLYQIEGDSLRRQPGELGLTKTRRLIQSSDNHLLALSEEGLSRCVIDASRNPACTTLRTDIDDLLREGSPYTMISLTDGKLAIGFDGQGVALLTQNGSLLRHFGEEDGLMNLEVMGLFEGPDHALWLALYDGLARIDPSPAWSSFSRGEGLPSSVSRIIRSNQKVFAATMLGLYELDSGNGRARFRKLPGSDMFVNCWDLLETDNQLFTACSSGLARIDQERKTTEVVPLFSMRTTDIAVDPSDSSFIYLGGEEGVARLQITASGAELMHRESIGEYLVSIFVEPRRGEYIRLWAADHTGEAYRVDIPDDDSSWSVTLIDSTLSSVNQFFWLKDRLGVATEEGLFWQKDDHFVQDSLFVGDDLFPIGQDSDGNLWLNVEDSVFVLTRDHLSVERVDEDRFSLISDLNNLYAETDGTLWFGHGRGIVRYQPASTQDTPPSVLLRLVKSTRDDSLLYKNGMHTTSLVPYEHASLLFKFAAPVYDMPVMYRVWLDGFEEDWQPWVEEATKEFTNLNEGDYTLRIQAMDASGQMSKELHYSFTVLPPWYRTSWGYGLWILGGGLVVAGLVLGYNRARTRRLQMRNLILERRVSKRTEEIREQKAIIEHAYEEVTWTNEELRLANQRLEERTDQLRDALEANKEILGITAHDLKNPLGGIIGLAEMILYDATEGKGNESIEENVPMLKGEAERMLQIVKDLLDSHRQDEGVALRKEKTKLDEIVSTVLRWNGQQAQNKKITLVCNAKLDVLVEVDVMAIQRVLDNYVSNAIKYSPSGSRVCVQTNIVSCASGSQVRVTVQDEGPGLTESDKAKAFGKLQRLSAKPTGGEHSTGLGLFIVKKLVEAHDGEVGVESTYGEGAAFWFGLPLS